MTDRVIAKDGKPYLVSTMRYEKRDWDEIWETAVFEGSGCLTLGRLQRYSEWSFDPEMARQQHAAAIYYVRDEPLDHWMMKRESIAETRKSAYEIFNKPPNLFGTHSEGDGGGEED